MACAFGLPFGHTDSISTSYVFIRCRHYVSFNLGVRGTPPQLVEQLVILGTYLPLLSAVSLAYRYALVYPPAHDEISSTAKVII